MSPPPVSVCLCVCVCVFLSVQVITFESLDIETSFLVCRYILTIARSSLSIKVIGSRSRSYEKNDNITYFNMSIHCIWLQVINEVKVTHQGEGSHQGQSKSNYFLSIFMQNFTYFNILFLCVWLQLINKVKFIHQGEGHIKVKVKYLHPFKFYVAHTFCKRVVCIRLNAFLFAKRSVVLLLKVLLVNLRIHFLSF